MVMSVSWNSSGNTSAVGTDNNSAEEDFNTSALFTNESDSNVTDVSSSGSQRNEVAYFLDVIIRPILIVLGTYGNAVSFYIMRRGSLKKVSTCFYMAILAIADTG